MTWAWVGTAGMVAVFFFACIVIVLLFASLAITVKFTIDTIVEWRRESREAKDDSAREAADVAMVASGSATAADIRAARRLAAVPPRTNVVSIMRHEDQE